MTRKMSVHRQLQRLLRKRSRLLPSGGMLAMLRWRSGNIYRLVVVPPTATFVLDPLDGRYFDRLHPLSDTFYERAPQ